MPQALVLLTQSLIFRLRVVSFVDLVKQKAARRPDSGANRCAFPAGAEQRAPQNRSGPDPRHANRANVAFCDGHVETMAPQDMGYVVRPDGSIAADAPGATNRLFSGNGADKDTPPAF